MRKTIIKLLGGYTLEEVNNNVQYVAQQMNQEFDKVLEGRDNIPQVHGFMSHKKYEDGEYR